jgi:hypothetical protein
MKFVATKTADQLDLQALHRVRERQRDHVRSGNPETGLGKSDIAFKQFETTRRAA